MNKLAGLPDLAAATSPAAIWIEAEERIRAGWLARKASPQTYKQWDSANSFLKREIYRLVNHFIDAELGHVLQDRATERGVAFDAEDSDERYRLAFCLIKREGVEVPRRDRHRFSNELVYAVRHQVPAELLIGFLSQVPDAKRIPKFVCRPRKREAWYAGSYTAPKRLTGSTKFKASDS